MLPLQRDSQPFQSNKHQQLAQQQKNSHARLQHLIKHFSRQQHPASAEASHRSQYYQPWSDSANNKWLLTKANISIHSRIQ